MGEDTTRLLRLSHAFNPSFGCWIGAVSDRHPANGNPAINVLATAFLPSESAVLEWFDRIPAERPWESGGRIVYGLAFLDP